MAVMYPNHSRFVGNIPLSLRRFTNLSDRDMGCFVSNIEPYYSSDERLPWGYVTCRSETQGGPETNDELLWESARMTKKLLQDGTSTASNQTVGLLKFVSDYPKLFYGRFGKKRENTFEVSNIGLLDGGAKGSTGKAYFDWVQFSGALSAYGNPYTICVASARNGYMTVSSSWGTEVVADEEALELVGWLESALVGLGDV
ncbi:hypothetical protein LSUE1_G004257 [Lachnellula suecica]|uniref:Uncharacterized protein n=1 Tax=Lachnellula suecica TaxID=602035 RepID=A0A8T9C8V3_9HELO|nr:hypothetical protein LSUE1_G004257 [Lachnellula suecica]